MPHHGHYSGRKGIAYYGAWVSQDYQNTGLTDWQVMCGNSAGLLFRGKERVNIGQNPAAKFDGDFHLFINEGFVEEDPNLVSWRSSSGAGSSRKARCGP